MRLLTLVSGSALLLTAGCGSVSKPPEEAAAPPVQLEVKQAKFSQSQQLPGDRVTLSLTVTNTGANPVKDLIVSLEGNEPEQLAVANVDDNPNDIPQSTDDLPNTIKRAAWFIDDGPQHSPLGGGDSWNGGSLAPGKTTTLRWHMAAITSGRHTLNYFVSGGLTDKAAAATSGSGLEGSVTATIDTPGDTTAQGSAG
ncbi:MAG: hypothetical protein J7513_02000 [Solirubrobacteraceae bacterium]|nr:hypothetical protein [Solirubrobacteraceae bacterium]